MALLAGWAAWAELVSPEGGGRGGAGYPESPSASPWPRKRRLPPEGSCKGLGTPLMAATLDAGLRVHAAGKVYPPRFCGSFPVICRHHPPRPQESGPFRGKPKTQLPHSLSGGSPPLSSELPRGRDWAWLGHRGLRVWHSAGTGRPPRQLPAGGGVGGKAGQCPRPHKWTRRRESAKSSADTFQFSWKLWWLPSPYDGGRGSFLQGSGGLPLTFPALSACCSFSSLKWRQEKHVPRDNAPGSSGQF